VLASYVGQDLIATSGEKHITSDQSEFVVSNNVVPIAALVDVWLLLIWHKFQLQRVTTDE